VFDIERDRVGEVLKLRNVDNVWVLIGVREKYDFSKDKVRSKKKRNIRHFSHNGFRKELYMAESVRYRTKGCNSKIGTGWHGLSIQSWLTKLYNFLICLRYTGRLHVCVI
jgi:hypothetical protein